VLKEYPGSDGTLISSIRLASRYTKTDDEKIILIPPVGLDSSDYYLYSNPHELYEDIIKKHSDNPMSKFVMLKLALLQQKDGEYEASINTIREILQKYSPTALEKDILRDSCKAFFKQELEQKNYATILSHYERDKDILATSDSPEIFLIIGEAYRALQLHHSASLMFQMADKFFLEENRPPRLLFGLGESFFRMNDLKNAYKLFTNLVQKDATYKDVPFAYYRIGQILLKEKKYDEARKNLKIALCSDHKEVPKADISIGIAKALKGVRRYEEAITWTKKAVAFLKQQKSFEDLYDAYIELGDLYEKIGKDSNAAGILESALRLKGQDDEAKQHGVMFRLAQCYQRLNKVEEALSLLRKISVYQDTLWGDIAAEKIKEIDIRQKIMKINTLKSYEQGLG
jgi:tetratricopeptide (TPR) repeat protein